MKTKLFFFCTLALIIFCPVAVFAQIDNLTNMSAEWMRTSNRNAATDAADIVVYNPAGLTKLADGFHINFSNQTMDRNPQHSFDFGGGKKSYEQDSTDWFIPDLYLAYKKDKWCVFGGFYIPGGGATADYPDGSITTKLIGTQMVLTGYGRVAQLEAEGLVPEGTSATPGLFNYTNDSLEATSMYLTSTIGGAYAINDKISVAAGVRYIYATNTTEGDITFHDNLQGTSSRYKLDTEDTADGLGAILGVNITPVKELNIGIHYESRIELDFETDQKRDDFGITVDKAKNRRDFPAMIGMGAAYSLTPQLTAEMDFNWWFQKQADWGRAANGKEYSDAAGDCYSVGAALTYQVNPKFVVSGGFLYTDFLFDDIDTYYTNLGAFEVLYSDNWNLSAGFAYEVKKGLKFNMGLGWTIWADETVKAMNAAPMDIDVETENSTYSLTMGVEVSLFNPK
ncbi:MAG: hypothetical protein GY749_26610 [Desulfobacteraceae bacterium]|nr:hypothetical protein [Desulfobacteraceae bacterium]